MTTVSLDLSCKIAEKAKEKGIELPESYFVWKKSSNVFMSGKQEYFLMNNCAYNNPVEPPRPERVDGEKIIRAYSADEISDMLPKHIEMYYLEINWVGIYANPEYVYRNIDGGKELVLNPQIREKSLAEALALLLIWLMEQGYMEVKK